MRQEQFYTAVGVFVIIAFAILGIGMIFFYEEYLHSKKETFVMFFKGSLKGLEANTPITYRGVKIGEVTQVVITGNKAKRRIDIPVYVEFFVEKTFGFSKNPINILIKRGFTANITKPNFLTGVADIEIIKTETSKPLKLSYYHGYPIFPTRNVHEKYTSVDDTLKAAKKTLDDISTLIRSKNVQDTIDSARTMANSVDRLANNLDQYAPSVVAYLNQSLKQISNAAYSTQNLTDYLSRYPESLLRGKK